MPPRWPTSPSSFRAPRRATRSRSTPASAISGSASCSLWSRSRSPLAYRLVRWRTGDKRNAAGAALAAERRFHLGAVHRSQRIRRMVRHERYRIRQGIVLRSGGDLPAQAQLDHVLALHRHLRLVHRLLCWLPVAGENAISDRRCAAISFIGPLVGALSRSATGWVADRWRARHSVGVRPDDDRRARDSSFPRH